MKSIIRSLFFAAIGYTAATMYHQWAHQRQQQRRHRMPLETWENEGGALPDFTPAGARTSPDRSFDPSTL
jgi:hypothetical protein